MHDDSFERLLQEAAAEYHQPTSTPRHEMWQRLAAARAARSARQQPRPRRRTLFPLVWAAGIAAGAVLGVGLGRLLLANGAGAPTVSSADNQDPAGSPTADNGARAIGSASASSAVLEQPGKRRRRVGEAHPAAPVLAAAPKSQGQKAMSAVYRVTLMEHLGEVEVFLTLFRVSVQRGSAGPLASGTARQLLTTNRLLLDSPLGTDRRTRVLLEDLELVLVRIAQISGRSRVDDLQRIAAGIERGGVLTRVRSEVPAGSGFIVRHGAL